MSRTLPVPSTITLECRPRCVSIDLFALEGVRPKQDHAIRPRGRKAADLGEIVAEDGFESTRKRSI